MTVLFYVSLRDPKIVVFSDMSMVDKLRKYFFISEIRKDFFELDLFLNILLHIQHVHYKNLLILNINYPLFF